MVSYDYASPQVIAPVLGVLLSVTRSFIPVREVTTARKERRLGVSCILRFRIAKGESVSWTSVAVYRS